MISRKLFSISPEITKALFSTSFFLFSLLPGMASALHDDEATSCAHSWHVILEPETDARFVLVMRDEEAVLDRETCLVWERKPGFEEHVERTTWGAAHHECVRREVGGRKGWRLPNIQELLSLVEPNNLSSPRLPADHPFEGVLGANYWSATQSVTSRDGLSVWVVDLADGKPSVGNKTHNNFFWCVRGFHGTDAQ